MAITTNRPFRASAPMYAPQYGGNWFTRLHPFFQGTIIVSGIAIAGYSAYRLDKYIQEQNKLGGRKDELDDANKELKNLEQAGVKRTLTDAQLSAMANKLQTAMSGYGTDSYSIGTVLGQLKNDADWLALVKTYGIREISSGTWNPSANFKGTLPEALDDELGDYEKKVVNTHFAKKGIKYKV